MNAFTLIISLIGLFGMGMAFVFVFLSLVSNKWRSLLRFSLIFLASMFGCLLIGFVSYCITDQEVNKKELYDAVVEDNKGKEDINLSPQNDIIEDNFAKEGLNEQQISEEAFGSSNKENELRIAIENIIGSDRLADFIYLPENNYTLITFKGTDSLTTNLIVEAAYLDIKDILISIKPIIDTDVRICVTFPIVDVYGNSNEEMVIKANYTLSTIQKINIENFVSDNVPVIADEWWNNELFVMN